MDRYYDHQKEQHGKIATYLWLIIGGIVFAMAPDSRWLSWQAAAFFVVGVFAASIVFGLIGYGMQRVVAKTLMRIGIVGLSDSSVLLIKSIGVLLVVVDAVVIYFAARWVVRALF